MTEEALEKARVSELLEKILNSVKRSLNVRPCSEVEALKELEEAQGCIDELNAILERKNPVNRREEKQWLWF